MTISRVIAAGAETSFGDPLTFNVNVGTGANRRIAVWVGWIGQTSMAPSTVTVGSDSLSASGAEQTGPGSAGDKFRLFVGDLTVTGTQTITCDYSGTAASGYSVAVCEVFQGSVGALTFGTPVFAKPEAGSAGTPTAQTVGSTTTSDKVCQLIHEAGGGGPTITATSPGVLSADLGSQFRQSIVRDGASGSTAIGAAYSAAYGTSLAAFAITEATPPADDNADGVTLAAAASLIAGSVGAADDAAGAIVTAAATIIAGSANAGTNATANGVTLSAAASFLAGAASGNNNATLNFQAAGMELGSRTGAALSTFGLDASASYRYTVHADGLVLGAALITSSAVSTDSAGKLPNVSNAALFSGVTYRVVGIRQSDGEAFTTRMVAIP
jgi:hypothetical protein